MTTVPSRLIDRHDAESEASTPPGQSEILGRESRGLADGVLLGRPVAEAWLRLGPGLRAVITGLALLLGLAVLATGGSIQPPPGQPPRTTLATGSPATGSARGTSLDDPRAVAVASWLGAAHAWADGHVATLCRSFTGVGAVDATRRGQMACRRLFSPTTGALLGLSHVDRPPPGVQYLAEDAFVLSDQRTVLVYGRRVRSSSGRVLDPGSSVVYVMRSIPRFGWRWVGTTDAEASAGWVPAGFPPVRG